MAEDKQYVWVNGEFSRSDQPVLPLTNRAFSYGDGFFETIHAYGTEAKHINLHYNRIIASLATLGMEAPSFLNAHMLGREITRLLNKNRLFSSVRVRVTFVRNTGGFYSPTDNSVSIYIQGAPLPVDFYPLNTKGLVIELFTDIRKPINKLSPIKSCNAQLYVMAGLSMQQLGVDDCLIINDQNRIAEAMSSNVFLVQGTKLYTPSLEEGCVAGVMRQVVLDLATHNGFKVDNQARIEPEQLLDADEVFLTDAITGIRWVVGLRQKRYFGVISKKLSKALNSSTF